jgi:hypothetical protein
MFVVTIFLWFAIFHDGYVLSMDCEYSSREYQVGIRPELLTTSFKNGINQILDELTKIERAQVIDFKVSVSSLKFKNVSVTEYIPASSRDPADFNVPLRFKSRQKKASEPADIVMKTSNADPKLACWPLEIAADYQDVVDTKFELDVYAENGRILPKTAHSYTIDLPLGFDRTTPINISKYLVNAANKLTRSGLSLIIVPDSIGLVTMLTAEFDIRLLGEKFEATIFLLQRASGLQSEFSFKVKDATVGWQILLASQQLIAEISKIPSIALFAA